MNTLYPWTACGAVEGAAGAREMLTLLLFRLQGSLGLKQLFLLLLLLLILLELIYPTPNKLSDGNLN